MHQFARRPFEQIGQPPHIGHPRPRIGPGGFEQDVIGLVFLEHIIDQVGRERDLLAGLALPRLLAFDQPADDRHFAKSAAQQVAFGHPLDEFVGQNIGR